MRAVEALSLRTEGPRCGDKSGCSKLGLKQRVKYLLEFESDEYEAPVTIIF